MDGACFCIIRLPRSWACGPEDGAERRDQRRQRRGVEDVLDSAAARGEVDAAVDAVRVLVLEHGVADVPEPGRPVQVPLVPGLAIRLRAAITTRAALRAAWVECRHVAQPVDLLAERRELGRGPGVALCGGSQRRQVRPGA